MTNQPIHCPKCDQPLTQVGAFWVCPEHGQISLRSSRGDEAQTSSASSSPLRIFLSYGHDSNEELVRRIKTDLEKRGHDVWFDKNEIKFGDEWRHSITELPSPSPLGGERVGVRGESGSHRVLSFLSKHSTRDPGVCRDEIAIATNRSSRRESALTSSRRRMSGQAQERASRRCSRR